MGQYKKNEMEEVKASIESLKDEIQTVKKGINVILNAINQMSENSPVANSIQTLQNPEFLKEVEKATKEMLQKVVPQMEDGGIGVATLQAPPQPSTYSFHDCVFHAPVVCGSGNEHCWESEETIEDDDDCESDEECECECYNDRLDTMAKDESIRIIDVLANDICHSKVTHFDELSEILHLIVLNPERYYVVDSNGERYAANQADTKTYISGIFDRIPPLKRWSVSDCMDPQKLGQLMIELYTRLSRDFVVLGNCKCTSRALTEIALHLLSKIIQVIRCKDIISPPGGDDD